MISVWLGSSLLFVTIKYPDVSAETPFFCSRYYRTNADVHQDYELQQFAKDVSLDGQGQVTM